MSILNHTYRKDGKVFKRTRKDIALKQIEKGKSFFIAGSNVNELHFHSGWHLATHIEKIESIDTEKTEHSTHNYGKLLCIDDVKRMYNSFNYYLDRELGRYPVFYVEQ